ncbi:glutaredoxin family protein [Methanofollis formosanus]|uniref:Glutaredoxin family protein n=1 Tax=Methanofollis formosanus TaxID=299308 RepID=A0A8G1EEJ4_9EURY|nr:glutaredoxin family protein [Methanofollis formosanus]QYZ78178.1 glutaredoxin family protein [Methanofollis formosanus]
MDPIHVDGKKKGRIMLYALSTCGWCAKTKDLLNSLGVEYDYLFVDQLPKDEMEKVYTEIVHRYNPMGSFPTLVINGKAIVGYQEDEIREALV